MLLILNDIAGSEILLIMVFILIFFGSKSIPGLAKTMGRTIRQIKEASSDIQSEIKKSANEMKGDLDLKGLINDSAEEIRRPLDQYAQDIDNAVKYTPPRKNAIVEDSDEQESAPIEEVKEEPPVSSVKVELKKSTLKSGTLPSEDEK